MFVSFIEDFRIKTAVLKLQCFLKNMFDRRCHKMAGGSVAQMPLL
jgi:hypothetical protein